MSVCHGWGCGPYCAGVSGMRDVTDRPSCSPSLFLEGVAPAAQLLNGVGSSPWTAALCTHHCVPCVYSAAVHTHPVQLLSSSSYRKSRSKEQRLWCVSCAPPRTARQPPRWPSWESLLRCDSSAVINVPLLRFKVWIQVCSEILSNKYLKQPYITQLEQWDSPWFRISTHHPLLSPPPMRTGQMGTRYTYSSWLNPARSTSSGGLAYHLWPQDELKFISVCPEMTWLSRVLTIYTKIC